MKYITIFISWIFSFSISIHLFHSLLIPLSIIYSPLKPNLYTLPAPLNPDLWILTTYSTSLFRYLILNILKLQLQTSSLHLASPLVFSFSIKSNPILQFLRPQVLKSSFIPSPPHPHSIYPMCYQLNLKNNQPLCPNPSTIASYLHYRTALARYWFPGFHRHQPNSQQSKHCDPLKC